MYKIIAATLVCLLVFSCANYKLTPGGRKIKVIKTRKAHKRCEVVGKVTGIHEKGSMALAKNQAKNKAADLGADSILFNEEFSNGSVSSVHSTAYLCK
ncbi:MAG: DUF4156 domain-containing protein [Bacteriovoracaceae bacterium]|nr:DUF4156 domain-containing protein [Bacteriovoracaceae bacterium]